LGTQKSQDVVSLTPPIAPRVGCHLLNLPLDLYRELFRYLQIDDLGRLDLALLNHQLREVYLYSLSGTSISDIDYYSIRQLIPWLIQRNILTKEFKIRSWLIANVLQFIIQSKPVLKDLVLSDTNVNGSDLQKIGLCPKLKCLSLPLSNGLTDRGIEQFLRNNPQLEKLSISQNPRLSNAILEVILDVCSHLQHLDLSHCSWVTDASLDLIEKSTLKLKSLDLLMCNVSKEKIKELIERSPSLSFLRVGGFHFDQDLQLSVLGKSPFQLYKMPTKRFSCSVFNHFKTSWT
jgi:hypothetical protein